MSNMAKKTAVDAIEMRLEAAIQMLPNLAELLRREPVLWINGISEEQVRAALYDRDDPVLWINGIIARALAERAWVRPA